MDGGAWRAMVHRAAKSRAQQKQLSTHTLSVIMFWFLSSEVQLKSCSSNINLYLGAYCIVFSKIFINHPNNTANTVVILIS